MDVAGLPELMREELVMRIRHHGAGLILALALAPAAASGDEIDRSAPELQPAEIEAAHAVSRVLFKSHQQEREIAEAAGLEDLDADIGELRSALRRMEASERVVLAPRSGGGGAAASAAAASRRQVFDGVARIARKREAVAERVASLASARQRRVAQRAVALLEEIEQEAREAADAPAGERVARLGALERRLAIERFGLAAQPDGPPTPTLQLQPASALHPLGTIDAP
jgi:hypothetical protein